MPDRDSVINNLDEIMRYNGDQMFYNDIFIHGIIEDAITLIKKQDERIKLLEHQLETLTRWRMNASAFD